MTTFIEARLLDCVAYGTVYARRYATQEALLRSGLVRRNASRNSSLRRYIINFQNLNLDDHEEVISAFEVCDGAAIGFRIKDWADYTATLESLGNTPGANQTPVQLIKTYTFGATTKTRTITKPTSGSVVVYSNGVAKAGTYSTSTGLFTPTTNWTAGHALTWSGEFDVPVRFASDDLAFSYDNVRALTANVELEEALDQVIDP